MKSLKYNLYRSAFIVIAAVFLSACSGNTFSDLLNPDDKAATEIDIIKIEYTGTNTCDSNVCGIGDTMEFTVTFSEPVSIGTGETVQVMIGDNEYIAITGPVTGSTATGIYTVTAGDDITSITPAGGVNTTGGTVSDGSGNDAVVDLGSGLAGNPVDGTSGFTIDGSAPVVSTIAYNSDSCSGSPCGATDTVDFDITFSEPVDLDAGDTIVIPIGPNGETIVITGALADATSATGTYTIATGHNTTFTPTGTVTNNDNNTDGDSAQDNAGNGLSTTLGSGATTISGIPGTLVVDLIAPDAPASLTLTSDTGVSGDGKTSANPVIISGTAEANSTVEIFEGSTSLGTVTADASGNFTANVTLAEGGPYTITAKATDAASNESSASSSISVSVDRTDPATTSVGMASGTPSTIGSGQTVTVEIAMNEPVVLSGTVKVDMATSPAKELTCSQSTSPSSTLQCSYTVASGDSFTIDSSSKPALTLDLSAGGTLTDEEGNGLSDGTSFTWDGSEPSTTITIDGGQKAITTISSTTAAGSYPSGTSIPITFTFSDSVTLSGDDLTVTLDVGGTTRTVTITQPQSGTTMTANYTVQAGDDGEITVTSLAAASGSTVIDASLSLPVTSNLSGIIGDTSAPAAANAGNIAFDTTDDTGSNTSDGITNKNTGLTFNGSAGAAEAGSTIVIYNGDPGSGGVQLGTATVNGDGSFSADFDLSPDGDYEIYAAVKDAAGNESAGVKIDDITIDTTVTDAASVDFADAANDDTGSSTTDKITSKTSFDLAGTAEAGSTVTIYSDATKATTIGTATADGSGNWNSTITLTEGTTTPYVVVTDVAGNDSTGANGPAITVDTTTPAAPSGTADMATASDTGTSTTDNITKETTITFTGSAGAVENNALVEFYDGATLLGSTTANADGSYSAAVDLSSLANAGTKNITIKQTDVAGNGPSAASGALAINIDTSAPAAPAGFDLAAASDSGSNTTDNRTNVTSALQLSGTAEANASIEIKDGATSLTTVTADGSGNWSATVDLTGEGDHNLTAIATDTAGNTGSAGGPFTVTIDTTAPDDNANSLAGNNSYIDITFDSGVYGGDGTTVTPVDASDLNLLFAANGGTATGVTISSVKAADNINEGSASALTGGETTIRVFLNVTGTADGNETITLSAVADAIYDNTANASSFTVGPKTLGVVGIANILASSIATDNSYIDITFDEAAFTTTGSSGALTASDFNVSFNANSGNLSAASISSVADQGSNVWRLNLSLTGAPAAGTETIEVSVKANEIYSSTDQPTPASETTGSITFNDKSAPAAPTTLALDSNDDTGTVDSDGVTNKTTGLTITGNAETGTTVEIFDGATSLGTTTASGGSFSFELSLAAGSHNITTKATDTAGNESAASSVLALTIDTTTPSAPSGSTDMAAGSDKGSSDTDNITNETSITFTGTAGAVENNAVVGFYDGTTLLGSGNANADGSYSLSIDLSSIANAGAKNITIKQTDLAGNGPSAASGTLSVTIDTSAPAAPSAAPDMAAASDTGTNTDNITSNTSVTFEAAAGTVETNAVVNFYDGTTLLGSGTANADGSYSISADLSSLANAGAKTITTKQVDIAGNESAAASSGLSVTIDTTSPSAPSAAPDMATASDTGTSNSDNITSNTSVTFTAVAGTVDANATVGFYDGATLLDSGTANADGSYSITADLSSIANAGAKAITAKQTDAAGNGPSTDSASLTVSIDTTDPVISSVAPASSSAVNNTLVSFTYSEICGEATITWSDTGSGSTDASAPHTQSLSGSELNAGAHNDTIIADNPTLTDSAVYNIAFDCTDRAGNTAVTVTSTNVTFSDAPLEVVSSETFDRDGNGKIDGYRVAFNKNVNDSTFPGYSANSAGSATGNWLVAGYNNVKLIHGSAVSWSTDTANDAVIYLGFDESLSTCSVSNQAGCDTGAKPDLTTTTSPALEDAASNAIAQVETADITEADGAKPVLIAAKSLGANSADVIFSEAMEQTTAETAAYYSIDNGISVSAASQDSGNAKIVHLTTGSQTGGTTYTLTVNTDIKDTANFSLASTSNTTTFDGLVKPVVAGIATTSATTLVITFNENIVASTAECSTLTACEAIYSNTSLPVKSAVSNAGAGTNSDKFILTVNDMVEGQNYTTEVLADTAQSVASSEKIGSVNNTATFTGDGRPGVVISADTAADCGSNGAKRVVVQYDQPVGTSATTTSNYKITQCEVGSCSTGLAGGNDTGASSVTDEGAYKYSIDFAEAFNTSGDVYRLNISGVLDANGNEVATPTNLSFQCGNDTTAPVLIAADVASSDNSSTQIMLTFSEEVDQVSANNTANYQYDSAGYGTNVYAAAKQANPSQVLVTFQPQLTDGGHQISVQNVTDIAYRDLSGTVSVTSGSTTVTGSGTSFDTEVSTAARIKVSTETHTVSSVDSATGITVDANFTLTAGSQTAQVTNVILANGTNNVQPVIVDAATGFSGGTVFQDPFGDDTPAGMIIKYDGKLYLGADKSSAKLFETDYGLTTSQTITLDADGTPGAPIEDYEGYLASYSGCAAGTGCNKPVDGVDTIYAACVGGTSTPQMTGSTCTTAGGVEKMFIGAYNTTDAIYRSYWSTEDKSSATTTFTFSEGEIPDTTTGTQAFRSTVFLVYKDQLWNHFGAEGGGGGRGGRVCANPSGCSTANSGLSRMSRVSRLGVSGNPIKNGSQTNALGNGKYLNAINLLYEYDNDGSGSNESQLYMANGGVYKGQLGEARSGTSDGGIVRTSLDFSTRSSLPGDCTNEPCMAANDFATGGDNYWVDVTPDSDTRWNNYVSIPYPENSTVTGWVDANSDGINDNCGSSVVEMDCTLPYNIFTPSMKAIPYMKTAPNGDLYMIRNACASQTVCNNGADDGGTCDFRTERQVCPPGSEVPQLWMLPKGTTGSPSGATDWVMVAEYNSTTLTGTVSVTSGTTTVTGSSTSFTTELSAGDLVTIDGQTRRVSSVDNDTQLTMIGNSNSTASGVTATTSSGKTNMAGNTSDCGSPTNICLANTHITLLEFVGDYIYIGFDNATNGSNVWRADMSSVSSGSMVSESDFSMVNISGLDGTASNQRLFSHVTVADSGTDWLIITTRDGTNAMQLYRTANDQN